MKVVVIGAVVSTKIVLEQLIASDFEVLMVFSLDESVSENVSGYYPLHKIAEKNNIPYKCYTHINDEYNIEIIERLEPDYIFAVGFSQLIGERILKSAKKGVIGFHPTPLPKFRGRAAMVWQVLLGVRETKCTMFFMDQGVDSGDIIAQEEYIIGENDYAEDIEKKLLEAIIPLTNKVINKLHSFPVDTIKQNEQEATYLLKRTPEDGLIDWEKPVEEIYRLIRAVSRPYPGAFSNYDGLYKIIIWRAEILENNKYYGLPGQIAEVNDSSILVVGKDGLINITDYSNVDNVKLIVGHKLKVK